MKVYVVVTWFKEGDGHWVREYEAVRRNYGDALQIAKELRSKAKGNFESLPHDMQKPPDTTFEIVDVEEGGEPEGRGLRWQIIEEELEGHFYSDEEIREMKDTEFKKGLYFEGF